MTRIIVGRGGGFEITLYVFLKFIIFSIIFPKIILVSGHQASLRLHTFISLRTEKLIMEEILKLLKLCYILYKKIYILIKEHMLFSLINNKQMCFFSSMNYSLKVFTTKLTSSF